MNEGAHGGADGSCESRARISVRRVIIDGEDRDSSVATDRRDRSLTGEGAIAVDADIQRRGVIY